MRLISDSILEEVRQTTPTFQAIYPQMSGFNLGKPTEFVKGQPFDYFKQLRENAPISWTPMAGKTRGFWAITRYDDVKTVALSPDIYSSEYGGISIAQPPKYLRFPRKLVPAVINSLINLDAPRHMELRIQQKDYFTPKFVKTLTENVSRKIDELLDNLEAEAKKTGEVDFVRHFSEQLPLYTLCEMLGIDEEDRPKIIRWMRYLEMATQVAAFPWQTFKNDPKFIARYVKNVNQMFKYGQRIMEERRLRPRKDLLTAIATSTLDGEFLRQEFLDGSWLLIIFAGNDTTRNSLSGVMRLLSQFPEQKNLVCENAPLIPQMLEESMRMISPVMRMRRTVVQETELRGQRLARNEKVVMWYGAANRDPEIFTNPDEFKVLRKNASKHIAFGHGPHKCLGSRIANLQLRMAYERILDRFPDIHWTGEQTIAANNFVHSISSLKVRLN